MTVDVWGRPHLSIRVGEGLVDFLLDTGAGIPIVKDDFNAYPVGESVQIQGISGANQTYDVKTLPLQLGMHTIHEKCAIAGRENLIGAETIKRLGLILDFPNMCIRQTLTVMQDTNDTNLIPMGLATQTVKAIKPKQPPPAPKGWESWWTEIQTVWAADSLDTGKMQTSVTLEGDTPPFIKQYPIPQEAKGSLRQVITELEKRNLIRRCSAPNAAPIWPVKKPDGTWRLTIDYRGLNKTAKRGAPVVAAYPELLEVVTPEMEWFSVLDVANGFWSLPLDPESQYRTSFVFQGMQYCWNVLPMGYCDAPTIFHTVVRNMLEKEGLLQTGKIVQYVDDILIVSKTEQEHEQLMRQLLTCCQAFGLKLNPSKSQIKQKEVQYLGIRLSSGGRSVDKERVKCIVNLPMPVDTKSLQSFLGLTNFCREFMVGYAEKAGPLYEVLKRPQWTWTEEATKAWESLKQGLMEAPTLAAPNNDFPFVLYPSVKNFCIVSMIAQDAGAGERPIAYYSRALTSPESKLGACEQIALSAYWTLQKSQAIVGASKVIVKSHHALGKLLSQENLSKGHVRVDKAIQWVFALMSENVQLVTLKEPEISVWGLNVKGKKHICQPQTESRAHPVFKAVPIDQVIGKTVWFVDGSSYYEEGERVTGFAGICLTGNKSSSDSFQYKLAKGGTQAAEVSAVLEVLIRMKGKQSEIVIGTDSDYVYKGTTIYLPWWQSMGFTGTDGSEIKHKTLWQQMERLSQQYKKIQMVKIKSHNKKGPLQKGNEQADTLAKEAALTGVLWEPMPVSVTTRAQAKLKQENEGNYQKEIQDLQKLQAKDDTIQQWITECPSQWQGVPLNKEGELILAKPDNDWVMVVPKQLKHLLLQWVHGSLVGGHPKLEEALEKLKKLGWWPGMREDLNLHLHSCLTCAKQDPARRKRRGELMHQAPKGPLQRLQVDFIGPLPTTPRGNRFLFVIVDSFSKWVEAFPTQRETSKVAAKKLLTEIFPKWGLPHSIDSDNGPAFIGQVYRDMGTWARVPLPLHIPYHPQAGGQVERMNKSLKVELSKVCNELGTNWDMVLPWVLMRIRSRPNRMTGFSPYEILFGRPMPGWENLFYPPDWETITALVTTTWMNSFKYWLGTVQGAAAAQQAAEQQKMNRAFNEHSDIKQWKIGDQVMVKIEPGPNKKFPKAEWCGPWPILEKLGPSLYLVNIHKQPHWKHAMQLKGYKG